MTTTPRPRGRPPGLVTPLTPEQRSALAGPGTAREVAARMAELGRAVSPARVAQLRAAHGIAAERGAADAGDKVTVRLERGAAARLSARARAERRTMSAVIARLLDGGS
jgi:hypothetical protein